MKISFLLIIVTSFIFYGVVGKDKIWLLAPLMISNYALIVGWLISKFLNNKNIKHKFSLPVDVIFWFLFLIYSICIIPFSSIPYESKLEILYLGSVIGSFLFWRNEHKSYKKNNKYFYSLLIVVLFCAVYGLVIHFKFPDQILWTDRYTDAYQGRLRSTYICPNHFAHLMQMIIPFCIAYLSISKSYLSLKLISLYSVIIFIPTLFFTESRAGWLGTIASIIVLLCLFAFNRSKKLFYISLIITPIIAISVLILSWNFSETFQRRMLPVVEFIQGQVEGGVGSESKDFRPQTWSDTITMIKDRPILGFGPGNYNYTFPKYRETFKDQRIITGHPHNEYLELISDYGLIGFFLFLIAWMSTLLMLFKNSINSTDKRHKIIGFSAISMVVGTMVHSFFDFQMHIFPNAMVFAFLLSISLAPQKNTIKNYEFSFLQKNKNYFLIILIIVYFIGLIFCFKILTSSLYRAQSEIKFNQYADKNYDSLNLINKSIWIDSKNWKAYKQLAKIYTNNRYYNLNLDEKIDLAKSELESYKKANMLNPHDPEIFVGIGKSLIFIGRNTSNYSSIDEGFEWLYKACNYKKFNNIYWWILGTELRINERYNEALSIFKKTNKIELTKSIDANIQWIERTINSENLIHKLNSEDKKISITDKREKSLLDILKERTKIKK